MSSLLLTLLIVYLTLNFLCALALHWHGERQAHLPLRFMDVFVLFVLMTAFAIPVLTVIAGEAMFGGEEPPSKSAAGKISLVRAA